MEIRRRKKGNKIRNAIIPLLGCAVVILLGTIFFFLPSLSVLVHGRRSTTTPRSAEDAHYQLNNRHIYVGETDKRLNGGNPEFNESSTRIFYQDPGAMDIPLTHLEKSRVQELRLPQTIHTVDSGIPYDIHRCPPIIPNNYPYAWSIIDVLKHWNPDDTKIPHRIYQGLCAIDWSDPSQRKIAVHYRGNEVPFIIKNHPVVWRVANRWSDYDYLHNILGDEPYRNEHSNNNHMMYWKVRGKRRRPLGWEPPTEDVQLSYPDWYQKAKLLEDDPDSSPTSEHYYLRLNGGSGKNEWLFDKEFPFFKPTTQNDIFMVDPSAARGINCRFGSRGTIAELHYDESRNIILILQGQKRYILGHPNQCINMELYPSGHPSARHSRINWSDPTSWFEGGDNFRNGMVNEVVLEAGDGLYLPTFWLHFIVSLSLNYQCNARSGVSLEYEELVRNCDPNQT